MKKSILAALVATGACLVVVAQADEIEFTTGVVRVIHDSTGVYAVTVRGTEGDRVVYVNEAGAIVQAPGTTTTTTVQTTQPVQSAVGTHQTVTTYDKVRKGQSRYELWEKKGDKEVYMDHQTGQKVTVKREKD